MENLDNKMNAEKSTADKIGGTIEKLGHKIADAGAEKLGKAVHDLGDKIETHHKNPEHPHKV